MTEPKKAIIYRNMTLDDFTAAIADNSNKAEAGSSAAAVAAIAAALLARAANCIAAANTTNDRIDWLVRNTEILRTYMVRLVDEDVKCRSPLRKALEEGDTRKIEASRQVAVSICLEIVNMMGKSLELAEELMGYLNPCSYDFIMESADLSYSASRTAGRYILSTSSDCSDDTYRFVMKRENEITMKAQKECYDRIKESWNSTAGFHS